MASKHKISVSNLCAAWTRHLLRRAIDEIAARSARDCRAAGLNRAETLAALTELHAAMGQHAAFQNAPGCGHWMTKSLTL